MLKSNEVKMYIELTAKETDEIGSALDVLEDAKVHLEVFHGDYYMDSTTGEVITLEDIKSAISTLYSLCEIDEMNIKVH